MTVKSLDAVCDELEEQIALQRKSLLRQLQAMFDSGANPEHIECHGYVDMYLTGRLDSQVIASSR